MAITLDLMANQYILATDQFDYILFQHDTTECSLPTISDQQNIASGKHAKYDVSSEESIKIGL